MADDQSACTGRRRGRGAEAAARAGALERLKAMQRDGRRSEGYVIKVDQPIYDTVPEEEYEELVKKRRHEAQGFIVDDDGLGYGDEGEEEDWSRAGLPPSSSDEEGGGEDREKRKRGERKERDKEGEKKRVNSELSAAAALMGKQRISSMLTSMVFKNRDSSGKVMGADCESILNNVMAEFAPDEGDKERRRRVNKEPAVFGKCSGLNSVKIESRSVIWKSDFGRKEEKLDEVNENVEFGNGNGLVEDVRDDVVERDEKESEVDGQVEKSNVEVKVEQIVKEEGSRPILNAKVNREVADPALSATREWQAVRNFGSVSNVEVKEDSKSGMSGEELSEFELNPDGSLPFFILDAHEEFFGANMGTVYLFGKVPIKNKEVSVQVKSEKMYHSCCAVVKNMQRCVYAIPKSSIFSTDEILRLEKDVEESKVSPAEFHKKLQDMANELKNEVASQLVALNVSTFSMTPVKRKYAFDRSDIPRGENYVLKINYPFKDPPLPSDLKGETFFALLGTHSSALELFLIKRKVKGPSWLSASKFLACPASQRVSWCKFEVLIDSPKEICVSSLSEITPPVAVTAINLKTVTNEKQNVNEIVSASIICCHRAKIDAPMLASECNRSGMRYFTVVRKLDGGIFPMGFSKVTTDRNTKAASTVLAIESSERALLNRLMIELHKLDTDVLVGHNISGFDLDVLLHRAQACRVPSSMWSKIGRLKRSTMPKITKGNFLYGSGASPGIMSCIAGRLLCDTYLCSRDLLKEVSYSLTHLAKTRLKKERTEISPHDIPKMFQKSSNLIELIEYGETDAWLSMELMFHLCVLPLTRQLTNISGNLWGKTLQGARAQRVEYLLLHAFHAEKYIVPDKIPSYVKEGKMTKRRMNHGIEDGDAQGIEPNDANLEDQMQHNGSSKAKRSPAYAGGLVLEPKKGLYDRYVLLLDFNSLYPSIIQEYNICFTTVDRSLEGLIPQLPSSKIAGVLPELLKKLVERRRTVKNWIKNTKPGPRLQQLDVQQQALKLTANSMYGCLGFSNSRFYAKPLAELITLQGREILQTTVDLVQNNLNLEVIYGDTDSIMIYSGIDDIAKAKSIADKVIQEVNKKYKCLEIDLDGLYSRMLLLKKKKYAAVKVQSSDGTTYEVIERKGLDMVRRDWSLLSKEVGDYCLSQILSGGSCEDVVESIHNSLMKVQEEMRNGQTALEKYVITKTLTKPPEAYPDAKNQPHVLVAQRLKQNGHTAGCSVGDTVPYIICLEQGASTGSSSGIAQRARHPDELVRDDGKWIIDIDYYLSQQILPVVSRLCASIQGTSPERLADCLGLDSSKYHMKSSGAVTDDPSGSLLFSISDEERYQSCEPLMLSCPSCSSSFRCPAVFSSICMATSEKQSDPPVEESTKDFWRRMHCPKCTEGDAGRISPAMIANQVKRQAEGFISRYYKCLMTCDDETCKHTTRSLNLRLMGDSERGTLCPNYPRCHGRLIRKFTEADLYKQLTYYCYLLDTVRCVEKMDTTARIPLEKELAKVRPIVELVLSTVQEMRNRCAYGWVRLNDLTVTV